MGKLFKIDVIAREGYLALVGGERETDGAPDGVFKGFTQEQGVGGRGNDSHCSGRARGFFVSMEVTWKAPKNSCVTVMDDRNPGTPKIFAE